MYTPKNVSKKMKIMKTEKDWADLGRNPETHVYTKCIKKR
jgi:hypothetical protein